MKIAKRIIEKLNDDTLADTWNISPKEFEKFVKSIKGTKLLVKNAKDGSKIGLVKGSLEAIFKYYPESWEFFADMSPESLTKQYNK